MPGHSQLRRSLAPLMAGVLLLGACGGDDESAGGSLDEWCSFAGEDAEQADRIFDGLAGGGDIEEDVSAVRSIIERLAEVAPAEIAADAGVVADGTLRLVTALEEADYQLLDADLSFMAEDGLDAQMDAASDNINAFTERECGRSFGTADDSTDDADTSGTEEDGDEDGEEGDFDPAAGTLREQLVAQFEALGLTADESACIAANFDFDDPALANGDVSAVFGVFETCEIDLARLAELGE